MSISQNFPEEGPTLNLNFAGSRTLDPRITFTRTQTTSNGSTYMGRDGLIKYAGPDEPRFDHRYVNGEIESLGLLIEEDRTNLMTYSEDWSLYHFKQSLDITTNDITSPDGAETADKLQCNASGLINDGFIQKLQTFTASTKTYTTSWFVKRGNTDRTNLSTALSGGTYLAVYAYIDWTNSPVSFNYDENNGNPGYIVHPLEEYPNGWYRASISISNNNTNTQITNRIYASSRSSTVSGDYVYAWGSQAEEGSFPTSYIPTEGSTKTRTADNASITGSNFTEWYNQSEGTLYVRANSDAGSGLRGVAALNFPSNFADDRFDIRYDQSGFSRGQFNPSALVRTSGYNFTNPKFILSYGENYNAFGINADITQLTSSFTPSTIINTLQIGTFDNFRYHLGGTISQLIYYPTRLTNSQLVSLTR